MRMSVEEVDRGVAPVSRQAGAAADPVRQTIFVIGPDGQAGGGMGRVKDYMMAAAPTQAVRFKSLVTRDQKGFVASLGLTAMAALHLSASVLAGRKRLVHVNMGDAGSAARKGALTLWARAMGAPVVLHLHAVQLHTLYARSGPFLRFIIRQPFRAASTCIVLGAGWRDWLVKDLGIPASKVEIVNNGVPVDIRARNFSAATEVSPRKPVTMLFLGNLLERKGVSDLLRAIAALPAGLPDWRLVLAGGGDMEKYKALAAELGVGERTSFVGWVDQQGARKLLADADLLVLPSYDEGLPLVILEALGSGAPVLCTPVGSIPEHLTDSVNARFVTPGDVEGMSARLGELIADTGLRQRLSDAGIKIFRERFTLSAFTDALFSIYARRFGMAVHGSGQPVTARKAAP